MNENESVQGGSNRPPWIAFSIVATVAIVILVAFFVAQRNETEQRDEQRDERRTQRLAELQRGNACPFLERAAGAFDTHDDDLLSASIKQARREAVRALDTTGIAFGKPERLALFIANDMREVRTARIEGRINDRLEAALEWCEESQAS